MTAWVIALLAGGATGILSAFGIGGGSLLLIYLTSFAALDQHQAQGINLLYFLPAGPPQKRALGEESHSPGDLRWACRRWPGCLDLHRAGHPPAA